MPLLRHSLYSQNVNLYLAPTADGRDTWVPLMRTVACEGRCFVLSANQCIRKNKLPDWIFNPKKKEEAEIPEERDSASRQRRRSIVTEFGHEIALPEENDTFDEAITSGSGEDPTSGKGRGRKASFVTEDGHEIVLPSPSGSRKSFKSVNGTSMKAAKSTETKDDDSEFMSKGGSCIIGPKGEILAGPLWEREDELLIVDADFDDCLRGRLDLDVAGSYSR
jgi:nitrilase